MVSEKPALLEIIRRAYGQKFGKFVKTDLMTLCLTISKSSTENAVKKLIEEGIR